MVEKEGTQGLHTSGSIAEGWARSAGALLCLPPAPPRSLIPSPGPAAGPRFPQLISQGDELLWTGLHIPEQKNLYAIALGVGPSLGWVASLISIRSGSH